MYDRWARYAGSEPARARILVVDDDEAIRRLLGTVLGRAGYTVVEAADGVAALAMVAEWEPDLVLLDVQMPHLDGIEVTRRLRARAETAILPVILVTGLGEVGAKVTGLDAGATDFVTKPFESAELLARVRAALRLKGAVDRLEDTQSVLVALANAVEAKDPTTEHHCNRLAGLALGLARLAGLDEDAAESIGYGAVLHDIGKIGVPEQLLQKPGALTDAEWLEMRRHPLVGARIVEPLRLGRLVAPIVRGHHERWDGSGYPDGVRGDAIPIGARIVSIVDAYDAMIHDRPYRRGRSLDEARQELRDARGRQFDPDLVPLFLDHLDSLGGLDGVSAAEFARGLRSVQGSLR